jgi:hypothetical protein
MVLMLDYSNFILVEIFPSIAVPLWILAAATLTATVMWMALMHRFSNPTSAAVRFKIPARRVLRGSGAAIRTSKGSKQ